jgi:hypothetical protein
MAMILYTGTFLMAGTIWALCRIFPAAGAPAPAAATR